ARSLCNALFNLVRNLVALRIASRDLNVDRRRNAEIQNLAHDVRRGEKELHVRKIAVQFLAQDVHVLRRRLVLWSERDKNFAVGLTDGGVVAESEINSAHRQSDVIQHVVYFVRRNHFANGAPDLIKPLLRRFEPRSRRCAHVQSQLPGVYHRKKVAPEKWDHAKRNKHHRAHGDKDELAIPKAPAERIDVAVANFFEDAIETLVNSV